MCSTPRSSGTRFSSSRRSSQPADYQAYARMLREASVNFERVQAMKEARRLAAAEGSASDALSSTPNQQTPQPSPAQGNVKNMMNRLWSMVFS